MSLRLWTAADNGGLTNLDGEDPEQSAVEKETEQLELDDEMDIATRLTRKRTSGQVL